MSFKLYSKDIIGIISMLLLVILLSQERILDFLFETYLGRAFLILLIIFISYNNHILGIVSVLFIIIVFNNSNIHFMEGMKTANDEISNKNTLNRQIQTAVNKTETENIPKINVTTSFNSDTSTEQLYNKAKDKTASFEGFDLIGTENTIKRGKQSNSISVNNFSKISDNVSPYEGDNFKNLFSL
jgi:hypothetical protein